MLQFPQQKSATKQLEGQAANRQLWMAATGKPGGHTEALKMLLRVCLFIYPPTAESRRNHEEHSRT
jgi:hypothetical protein